MPPLSAQMSRRLFLTAATTAVGLLAAPAGALANAFERRSVSFLHTHTGEKLSTTYFASGSYVPASLTDVNRFLRDFRTGEVATIDPGLLDILHDLKVLADRDSTFEIISGYRSPHTNAALRAKSGGVAEKSLHVHGKALDIRLTGFPTKRLRDLALSLKRGGVGYYAASDFIHVDTGRVRFW